jgi:hypothetical protein
MREGIVGDEVRTVLGSRLYRTLQGYWPSVDDIKIRKSLWA